MNRRARTWLRTICNLSVTAWLIATPSEAAHRAQRIPNKAEMSAIVDGVKGGLKDPDSAKFSEVRLIAFPETPKDFAVCGSVNARNSFGGYVGPMPFIGSLMFVAGNHPFFILQSIASDPESIERAITLCNRYVTED